MKQQEADPRSENWGDDSEQKGEVSREMKVTSTLAIILSSTVITYQAKWTGCVTKELPTVGSVPADPHSSMSVTMKWIIRH